MNITLSIDDKLAERSRKIAHSMGKSLDQLLGEYLEQLSDENTVGEEIAELRRLSAEAQGHSSGWKFDRNELHERT